MTAAALKLKLNLKKLNIMNKEQLAPEFVKLNPNHCVPTLVDTEFSIWESRAISVYLVEKYARTDALYPKDPKIRAVINQRFYFDMGTLFKSFYEYYFASFYGQEMTPENLAKFEESVKLLETFLEDNEYVAGTKRISLADIALFATVSTFEVVGVDLTPYPNVEKWLALMEETVPGLESNNEGLEMMRSMMKQMP